MVTVPTIVPTLSDSVIGARYDFSIDRIRHSVYIDDLNLYGSDAMAMSAAQQQYIAAMTSVGLPPKPSKIVAPTSQAIECLGVEVNGDTGEVGVSVTKVHKLRIATLALLDRGWCTGVELSQLIGKWTWCMLIRRPALSIFSAVYRFILITKQKRYQLWPSLRRELHTAAMMAPLLFTNIRSEFIPRVIASDASEEAQGVVATSSIAPSTITDIASLPVTIGLPHVAPLLSSSVVSANWSTIVSAQWHRTEHINSLELRASLTAIRWSLTLPSSIQHHHSSELSRWCGHRLLLLSDSSTAVGGINKGRSSSHKLLRPLRSIGALLLASGIQCYVAWIPSKANPADAPSRRWS